MERNADDPNPTVMMVAHNSRGSPTLPCTDSYEEEVADEVQDFATTLAATVSTTPQVVATLNLQHQLEWSVCLSRSQ